MEWVGGLHDAVVGGLRVALWGEGVLQARVWWW